MISRSVETTNDEEPNYFDSGTLAEIKHENDKLVRIIVSIDGNERTFEQERRAAMRGTRRAVISERYYPPRVRQMSKMAPACACAPGVALDLTTNDPQDNRPWDFSILSKRERARRLLDHQKPMCLIGSPPCTRFSSLQRSNDVHLTP